VVAAAPSCRVGACGGSVSAVRRGDHTRASSQARSAAEGTGEVDGLPSWRAVGWRVMPRLDGATLTLGFHGELDGPGEARALGEYLGRVTEAMEHRVRRVVLDLSGLDFVGAEAGACLGEWLSLLRALRAEGLAPSTLRYSEASHGQRAAVASLHQVDGALMLDPVD
jgi:hypothetical protein